MWSRLLKYHKCTCMKPFLWVWHCTVCNEVTSPGCQGAICLTFTLLNTSVCYCFSSVLKVWVIKESLMMSLVLSVLSSGLSGRKTKLGQWLWNYWVFTIQGKFNKWYCSREKKQSFSLLQYHSRQQSFFCLSLVVLRTLIITEAVWSVKWHGCDIH